MANPTIGQGYSDYIGTRTKPGQTQVEYYNKQNNMAFGTPQELFGYASTLSQGPVGSFDQLAAGFTPRAQQLQQITESLNQGQNQAFSEQQQPAKRQASSIQDSVNNQQSELDNYLKEYGDLKTKLQGIGAPNYQDSFNQLRQQQGIPGLEKEYTDLSQQRRELPYIERANTGNAGVATESQLQAQTNEKDVPLYIKQSNAIDRLKIAQSFVESSLKLKELDHNASRQALTDAADIVSNVINFGRDNLNDLYARSKDEEAKLDSAKTFALQYGVTEPLYKVGNVIYNSQTGKPEYENVGGEIRSLSDGHKFSSEEEFFKATGLTSFKQIKSINLEEIQQKEVDRSLVLDLVTKYFDAGILPTDSLQVAQQKAQRSRIYQEQVRPPVGAGGGSGGGGVLGLTNQQIDNISPLVTQFQNSPIVQNYNTIGEGYSFVKSLSNDTKNPADDQALIYALAKALDPGSVVREGEYATVQKYAQSMVQSYGKSVTQALSGSGFLSGDARKNIKSTIESRFRAAETSYKNLYSETERRVNLIGNTDKGNQLLNNYGGAFAPTNSPNPVIGPVNPASNSSSTETPQTQGFWKKATNWLFGD